MVEPHHQRPKRKEERKPSRIGSHLRLPKLSLQPSCWEKKASILSSPQHFPILRRWGYVPFSSCLNLCWVVSIHLSVSLRKIKKKKKRKKKRKEKKRKRLHKSKMTFSFFLFGLEPHLSLWFYLSWIEVILLEVGEEEKVLFFFLLDLLSFFPPFFPSFLFSRNTLSRSSILRCALFRMPWSSWGHPQWTWNGAQSYVLVFLSI